jgi:uncharacterized Zn finger protein (UPF0148 family)
MEILMKTLKHTCDNCEAQFKIVYDGDLAPDDPTFCPFCSEYIMEESEDSDDLDL